MNWDQDRIEQLRTLAARGDKPSGQDIADIMGGSRSSIISACHRYGISLQGKARSSGPRKPRLRAPKAAIKPAHQYTPPRQPIAPPEGSRSNMQGRRIHVPHEPANKPAPLRPARPPAADTRMVTLFDLQAHQCRYPFGDHPPYLYCGAPKKDGSSYCDKHDRACNCAPVKKSAA